MGALCRCVAGPAGVLMDRMGNSLDRSLLLAEVLRRIGATVRLAHGTLDDKKAPELLDRLIARDAQAVSPRTTTALPGDGKVAQMQKQMVDRAAAQVSAISSAISRAVPGSFRCQGALHSKRWRTIGGCRCRVRAVG